MVIGLTRFIPDMTPPLANPAPQWRSRMTFVMALASATVGLSNLWRFSYLVGENGGGLFVLTYVVALLMLAVPMLVAELVLGNHGRGSPLDAVLRAGASSKRSRWWSVVAVMAMLTGFLIAVYGSVVASWSMAYAVKLSQGEFAAVSIVQAGATLGEFLQQPDVLLYWFVVFLLIVLGILALGMRRGLGLLAWLLIPLLVVGLWVSVQYGLRYGDLAAAKRFLFSIEPLDYSFSSFFLAISQAFFTLGIGVGVGVAYGAYAPAKLPVGRSVLAVALFDTLVAVMAGVALFPILFANNVLPVEGAALAFVALPFAYGNVQGGDFYGAVFYLLMAVVALGSTVALLEPLVMTLGRLLRISRLLAVVIVGAVSVCVGAGVVLSLNLWQARFPLGGRHFFAFLEHVTTSLLMPLSALLLTIFVAWRVRREVLRIELYRESRFFFSLWLINLRYIAPPVLIALLYLALR